MIQGKRSYKLNKRAGASEDTRLRIIEAARSLFSESGYPNVSLEDIAEKAGVSRQTLYVQFGSKVGVLQALNRHIVRLSFGTNANFEDHLAEVANWQGERPHSIEDIMAIANNGLHMVMHFYETNASLLRNFQAQAVYDSEFRSIWSVGLEEHWQALGELVHTVHAIGCLAPGWTVKSATDWIASITQFNQYDLLVIERGWTADELVERQLQLFRQMLIKSES